VDARLVGRRDDGFELHLGDAERQELARMLAELRTLLIAESPASDPAMIRLFPPAYPDDLLQNLDFERGAGHGLLAERLGGLDEALAALDTERMSEAQTLALLGAVNDLRLVYGVKLDVTETSALEDFPDERERATFDLYQWLGWLVQNLVEALSD